MIPLFLSATVDVLLAAKKSTDQFLCLTEIEIAPYLEVSSSTYIEQTRSRAS